MREGWKIRSLGDIASYASGSRPSGGVGGIKEGVLSLGGEHIGKNGWLDLTSPKYVEHDYYTANPKGHITDNDILLCKDGALTGKVAIVRNELVGKKAMVNEHVFVIRSCIVRQPCLYYFLFSPTGQTALKARITGAAQGGINGANLKTILVPVPPIAEQEKIVAELDCLTGIIEKKKQQLEELDKLAQSIFYDMFGDPIINEKGFPVQTIDDVIAFQGGSQPAKSFFQYEATEDNIRLIQTRDYRTDSYITYIPKSLARRFCNKEDIMIGRYGPPIFQIFKGLEGAYNVALMKAIPKKGNREFIRAFLQQKCLLHYLENFSQRVAGQDGIQMDKLKSYPFPYPPTDLQDLFAQKVEAIEKQKELVKRSIVETETLFNSRMDYWFN